MKVIEFKIIKGDREKVYPIKVGSSIFEFLQTSIPPLHSYDILGDEVIEEADEVEMGLNLCKNEVVHKLLSHSLGIDKSDVRRPVDFNNPYMIMNGVNVIKINIEIE